MNRSVPPDPRVPPSILIWDENGIPRAEGFDDTFFDGADPVGERRHVFLDGCDLPDAWTGRERFTVGETGFGTGLSVLLLIEAWRKTRDRRPPGARLDILSVEGYPLDIHDLTRAHRLLPEGVAADAAHLRAQWPPPYRGPHRIVFPEAGARLTLMLDEAAPGLARMEAAADAWFLDGFAPAANPDMWTEAVLRQVTRLCAPGARLASFTAAGAVRRALQDAGATVTRRPGFGRKRHCLAARIPAGPSSPSPPVAPVAAPRRAPWHHRLAPRPAGTSVLIVGGGIAARCCALALAEHGMAVTRIAPGAPEDGEAPHPPAILLAPNLVRGGDAYARLSALAYLDALRRYEAIADDAPGLWLARGVSDPARAGDAGWWARQSALADALGWPESVLRRDAAGLHHPRAGVIDPAVLHDWLDARTAALGGARVAASVARLDRRDGLWRALSPDGDTIASAPVAVLAAGPWSTDLLPESVVRDAARHAGGRLFLVPGSDLPRAVNRGGFLTQPLGPKYGGRAVLGASARRGATADEALAAEAGLPHGESLRLCLDRLAENQPDSAARIAGALDGAPPKSWTGVRATTPDHLPMAGPVPDDAAYRRSLRGLARGARGVRRAGPPDSQADMPDAPPDAPPAWDRPGLFTVAALGARGYQLAPLLADMLAAELTGGVSPLAAEDLAALHPGRFLIRAMARE